MEKKIIVAKQEFTVQTAELTSKEHAEIMPLIKALSSNGIFKDGFTPYDYLSMNVDKPLSYNGIDYSVVGRDIVDVDMETREYFTMVFVNIRGAIISFEYCITPEEVIFQSVHEHEYFIPLMSPIKDEIKL